MDVVSSYRSSLSGPDCFRRIPTDGTSLRYSTISSVTDRCHHRRRRRHWWDRDVDVPSLVIFSCLADFFGSTFTGNSINVFVAVAVVVVVRRDS